MNFFKKCKDCASYIAGKIRKYRSFVGWVVALATLSFGLIFIISSCPRFTEQPFSEWFKVNVQPILTVFAILVSVLGLIYAFVQMLHSKIHSSQIEEIRITSENIADATRKRLVGIERILVEYLNILLRVTNYTIQIENIWFIGFTLGLGVPHKYKKDINNTLKNMASGLSLAFDLKRNSHNPQEYIDVLIEQLNQRLAAAFRLTRDAKIACLKQDEETITTHFIGRFKERKGKYEDYTDSIIKKVTEETILRHKKVQESLFVQELEDIPIQMFIVEFRDNSAAMSVQLKRECVIFLVGTENLNNISENGEQGYYSANPEFCDMFIQLAESLYGSQKSNTQKEIKNGV